MMNELDRLITKYSGPPWSAKPTANRVVELLTEHLALLQIELGEVLSGVRTLTEKDILGPKERARQRSLKRIKEGGEEQDLSVERKDHSSYFMTLEQKRLENKRLAVVVGALKKQDDDKSSGKAIMSDAEFITAISHAVSQLNALEGAGGKGLETSTALVERLRKVVKDARMMIEAE